VRTPGEHSDSGGDEAADRHPKEDLFHEGELAWHKIDSDHGNHGQQHVKQIHLPLGPLIFGIQERGDVENNLGTKAECGRCGHVPCKHAHPAADEGQRSTIFGSRNHISETVVTVRIILSICTNSLHHSLVLSAAGRKGRGQLGKASVDEAASNGGEK
jgi:hypothetical protein